MGLGSSGDSNCDRRTEGRSDEASTRDATHLKSWVRVVLLDVLLIM